MKSEQIKHYLVIVYGDVEPEVFPFETVVERDNAAIKHKSVNGDDDGIFKLDIVDGIPEMTTYSNKFFWDALGEWVD
jgi:hypothetical protein